MKLQQYTVPDNWYTSENLRLELIASNDRWFKNKHGFWHRKSYGATHHVRNSFGQSLIVTEHFIKRLYQRSGLAYAKVISILKEFNLHNRGKYTYVKIPTRFNNYQVPLRRAKDGHTYITTTFINEGIDDGE